MLNQKSKSTLVSIAMVCCAALTPLSGGEQPVPAAAKNVAQKKLQDYAVNGSFAKLNKQGTSAVGWYFWKRKDSNSKLTFEKNGGVDESTAAVLSGGECTLSSCIKILPKEKIMARVSVKRNGKGTAVLSLRFQDAKQKWLPQGSYKKILTKDGEWETVEITVIAPDGAVSVLPILGSLDSPDGTIRYSKFELYKVLTSENHPVQP